jgi:RNA polymerase sigma-70 factor (ECF subfamily)
MMLTISTPDEERFRLAYQRHAGAVWRYLARRLGDDDLAEDLTSEVFVIAWRRRRDAPADSLPWLYGVARRVLSNDRRAARAHARRVHALAEQLAGAPAEEPSGVVAAALARLSERDREVLLLIAWEGLEPHELPAALGCLAATARVRLHRARRRFSALLDSEGRS